MFCDLPPIYFEVASGDYDHDFAAMGTTKSFCLQALIQPRCDYWVDKDGTRWRNEVYISDGVSKNTVTGLCLVSW